MPDRDPVAELTSKVDRINVLQSLIKSSSLFFEDPKDAEAEIEEKVRNYLCDLLKTELGMAPQSVPGTNLTPEKAQALDAFLEKLVQRQQAAPVVEAKPEAKPVATRAQQVRTFAGGDEVWQALSPEDRAKKTKEFLEWQSKG